MNLFNPPKVVNGTLVDVNGNAYAILSHWRNLARKQGWSDDDIELVFKQAKSGDYDNLLIVIMAHMN